MKYLLITAVVTVSLSGCVKLWEVEQQEIIPMPEVEFPITPAPWEPGETQDNPIDS